MVANIKIFDNSIPQIGYISRTSTKGQEYNMVRNYIKCILGKYANLKNKHIAIFVEPQIDTGYPDIVIIEYYHSDKLILNEHRLKLSIQDLKILFHIQKNKNVSLKDLESILGFHVSEIKKSISRLEASKLIHVSKGRNNYRNIPLSSYSRIKKIISIEAKLDKWSEAIKQAEKNLWFSTESYILMNKECCSRTMLSRCEELGIGIILQNGKMETKLKGSKRDFPVSFTSLLFSEWIFRLSYRQED